MLTFVLLNDNDMTKKKNVELFIEKAREVHGNKYDYSQVVYKTNRDKVKIICPIHGVFEQTPNNHIHNHGCPLCGGKSKLSFEEFVAKANKIYNNKYDYSQSEYKNIVTKIKIICPEHGAFMQTPRSHLSGSGCAQCRKESLLNLQSKK